MKCLYCYDDCVLTAREPTFYMWKCESCRVDYQAVPENNLIKVIWYNIEINDHIYYVNIYPNIGYTGNAPEFNVYEKKTCANLLVTWEEVIHWDFLPDWTPHNVKEKLKTCLTFL